MIFRIYWRQHGPYVYARVFPEANGDFRDAGELALTLSEFMALYRGQIQPEFIEEQPQDR